MSAKYQVRTFDDMVSAIQEEIGCDPDDSKVTNRIKRDLNFVYLQEVCPAKNWTWLTKTVEVQAKAFFSTGTVTITAGSVTATLTETPAVSYKDYYFSTDGYNEIYRIAQHSAGSSTLTLESQYSGTSGSSLTFRIWTDRLALPADCSRTTELTHNFRDMPLESLGRKEFKRVVSMAPKAMARPENYALGNLVDPAPYDSISGISSTSYRSSSGLTRSIVFSSSLGSSEDAAYLAPGDRIEVTGAGSSDYNGEWVVSELATTTLTNDTIKFTAQSSKAESSTSDIGITVKSLSVQGKNAQYRELFIYPSLFDAATTLKAECIMDPPPMVEDDDEPLIPLEDRGVLVYGALSREWIKHRDTELFSTNQGFYANKLAHMEGRVEDSMDLPRISPSKFYLRAKRRAGSTKGFSPPSALGFSPGGGATSLTGTANRAAIFDSTGRLVSDNVVSTTELEYLDGVTSSIQTQLDSKMSDALTDGHLFVGSALNIATDVAVSGDLTLDNTGNMQIVAGAIVNADINASAAITKTKLATGTASRVEVTDGSGNLTESAVTSTELTFLSGVVPLTSVSLADNQSSVANVVTFAVAKTAVTIEYSLVRGSSNVECGQIFIVNDGSTASIAQAVANIGSLGVTFSADVSGGNVRLRYTSTNTGTAPTFQYRAKTWAA